MPRKKHAASSEITPPSAFKKLRTLPTVCYAEDPPRASGTPKHTSMDGLSFRFDASPTTEIIEESKTSSVMTPERSPSLSKKYPYPTGSKAIQDYREAPPASPLNYATLILASKTKYLRVMDETYTVYKKDLLRPKMPRHPTNKTLFKESAKNYSLRKNLISKPSTRFELCHNIAHRFLGNHAQTSGNIFSQTAHFNSQQLVAENIIARLAQLLGQVTVHQVCEKFRETNIGKLVRYEIKLPGCKTDWTIEVKAENSHIRPHLKWTKAQLILIAKELIKSRLPDIQRQGEALAHELQKKPSQKTGPLSNASPDFG